MGERIDFKVDYEAEPTASRFHYDDSFFRGIMGPIGSGKSVTCCIEIASRAMAQPADKTGRRRTRWGVIRNTYPELKSTTIKTWQDWFPEEICPINWGAPITGRMVLPLPDDTVLDMEILFVSMDRPKDVRKLLSLELTGVWLNEARELDKTVIDAATGRVGRYPPKRLGGPAWSGVIADTNPPDDTHWWYEQAEEKRPEGWAFYRQPGALLRLENGKYVPNVEAENVTNQPHGYEYWLRQVHGKDQEWINVYVLGQYGSVMDGKPIYETDWNDRYHVSEYEFVPLRGQPIILGWDYGLSPACIIAQVTPRGQVRILDEIVGSDISVEAFAEGLVLPLLHTKYHGHAIEFSVGDPSGKNRGDSQGVSARKILKQLGIPTANAPSNDPQVRWDAVRHYLGKMMRGEPMVQLDPRCRVLRRGFNGGYRFRQMQVAGGTRYAHTADKNKFSHPHDALQYLLLQLKTGRLPGAESYEPEWIPADDVMGY